MFTTENELSYFLNVFNDYEKLPLGRRIPSFSLYKTKGYRYYNSNIRHVIIGSLSFGFRT
jgi:hypothetical protein